MTPRLRFPEFTDEWRVKKLGDFSVMFSGGTPTSTNRALYNGTIPFIRSGEISSENTAQYISEEALKKSSAKIVNKGDILYALYGATSGQVAVSRINGAINQAILCIRPGANHYFIYSKLASNKSQILNTYLQGGQGNLSSEIIKSLKIGLPSEAEQEKIAEFLTAVDKRIAAVEKKLELLCQYKKGVMQKIFTQAIRFKDEDSNDYPDWEKRKLGDILKERNLQAAINEDYPLMAFVAHKGVVSKGDRYDREFLVSDARSKKYKRTQLGDFIYSSNNLESGSIGLNQFGSASISPVYSIFEIVGGHSHRFLGAYLTRKELIYQMTRYRQGVVYGQWNIHESEFLEIEERLPSVEEQQRIATFLTALDDKIATEQTRLAAARAWKKGLLQRMFV